MIGQANFFGLGPTSEGILVASAAALSSVVTRTPSRALRGQATSEFCRARLPRKRSCTPASAADPGMLMHFGRALPFVGHEPARRGTYVEHPADHLLVGGRLEGRRCRHSPSALG